MRLRGPIGPSISQPDPFTVGRRWLRARPLTPPEARGHPAARPDRAFHLVARSVYGLAALAARMTINPAGGQRPCGCEAR